MSPSTLVWQKYALAEKDKIKDGVLQLKETLLKSGYSYIGPWEVSVQIYESAAYENDVEKINREIEKIKLEN